MMIWSMRRVGLGLALLATLAAVLWVDSRDGGSNEAPVAVGPSASDPVGTTPSWRKPPLDVRGGDPFGPLVMAGQEDVTQEPVPEVPAEEVSEVPPLPFQYLGYWTENGKTMVFLSDGDRSYAVGRGDKLGDAYRVAKIRLPEIEFVYLPLKVRQSMTAEDKPLAAQPDEAQP